MMGAVVLTRWARVALLGVFLFVPHATFAATLSLSPAAASVAAGNIITVTAVVNSQGVAVNNAEAIIQFPTDLLQVISVSRSASIFTLWVEEPTFSNVTGRVSFNGGITNPGFLGSQGQLVAVTFRAVKAGTASVLLSDAAVRANDGLGTNVLSSKAGATLTVTSLDTPAPTPTSSTPEQALKVSSPTHPDQNAWYARKDLLVQWTVPSLVTTVQTGLDTNPSGVPQVTYTPAIARKEVAQVGDGVSYFHLRYRSTSGEWSKAAHFRVQIDTVAPQDLELETSTNSEGEVVVRMSADDSLSGIGYYSVQVDQEKPFIVPADAVTGAATTTLPAMGGTEHALVVQAFDRAGNVVKATRTVTAGALSVVNLTEYPTSVKVGQSIKAVGQVSYPGATVLVVRTADGKRTETKSVVADKDGVFYFESDTLAEPGITVLWVDLLNKSGDTIASSDKVSIAVKQSILLRVGEYSIELLSVLVPLVALVLLLVLLAYFGWHKFFGIRRRLERDLEQLKARAHGTFKKLSDEMADELKTLERAAKKSKSSAESAKTLEDLRSAVNDIDDYIQKMIKKIEDTDL